MLPARGAARSRAAQPQVKVSTQLALRLLPQETVKWYLQARPAKPSVSAVAVSRRLTESFPDCTPPAGDAPPGYLQRL